MSVDHPAHYNQGAIECIDALDACLVGLSSTEAFCTGNAIKYLWRWKQKNGVEDLRKARWYIDRLIAERQGAREQPDELGRWPFMPAKSPVMVATCDPVACAEGRRDDCECVGRWHPPSGDPIVSVPPEGDTIIQLPPEALGYLKSLQAAAVGRTLGGVEQLADGSVIAHYTDGTSFGSDGLAAALARPGVPLDPHGLPDSMLPSRAERIAALEKERDELLASDPLFPKDALPTKHPGHDSTITPRHVNPPAPALPRMREHEHLAGCVTCAHMNVSAMPGESPCRGCEAPSYPHWKERDQWA